MNDHLSGALKAAFPNLYRDHLPCVGDGWFLILWNLSSTLEPLGSIALQIKEKYGGLRFYLSTSGNDKIFNAISQAEEESNVTCENCGRYGGHTSSLSGWTKTLCAQCNKL